MVVTIFVLFLQYYEKTFTAVAVKLNCRPVGHGCYIRLVAARSSSFIYTVVLSMGRAMGGGTGVYGPPIIWAKPQTPIIWLQNHDFDYHCFPWRPYGVVCF